MGYTRIRVGYTASVLLVKHVLEKHPSAFSRGYQQYGKPFDKCPAIKCIDSVGSSQCCYNIERHLQSGIWVIFSDDRVPLHNHRIEKEMMLTLSIRGKWRQPGVVYILKDEINLKVDYLRR